MADLPMGLTEPTVLEDLMVSMEDIFRDFHSEGQQVDIAFREAVNGERVQPEATVTEKVTADRGQ